jgi:hypothetical protein
MRVAAKEVFMIRAGQFITSKKALVILVAVLVIGGGGGALVYESVTPHATGVTDAAHKLTQISYPGQNGKSAMTLLKSFASVKVRHYSFGDLVTSINGVSGNGPKYWTLFVNKRESSVGADIYITKNADTLTWKLQ